MQWVGLKSPPPPVLGAPGGPCCWTPPRDLLATTAACATPRPDLPVERACSRKPTPAQQAPRPYAQTVLVVVTTRGGRAGGCGSVAAVPGAAGCRFHETTRVAASRGAVRYWPTYHRCRRGDPFWRGRPGPVWCRRRGVVDHPAVGSSCWRPGSLARKRGTLHLRHSVRRPSSGIPFDEVMQAALIPVAYTIGTDFRPAARSPLDTMVHWDGW